MILHGPKLPARATIGGKARGLYRLRAAGQPVPDFLVIPAETFETAPAAAAGEARRGQLAATVLSAADQAAILAVLATWDFPARPVVVRSSVADEDGQQAAFPGMMDSFMNLTTLPAVWAAVADCAASAYSARAVAYRQQKGLTPVARPAVIIQRQVRPRSSGVLFSTFPEYPQELAVHAVWGFGEGLVGGRLEPDEFYFAKASGQLHRHKIAAKPEQLLAAAGPGLAVAPVPAAEQQQPCLTPAQLTTLFALGSTLETAFGGPQDVEFVADAAGQVWVVQARPITQPIAEVVVYDNSNIQESYCGVTTPLTFSFAQRAYATVYRQTMQALGLPAAAIRAHEPVVTQLLGLVQGRIYYNINNWYRGLQLLPAFRQNKADMERMMGVLEPVDFVVSRRKTLGEKVRLLPRLALNLGRLLWAFRRLPRAVPAFHARFQRHYQRFYELPLAGLSAADIWREKEQLDAALLQSWTTPIINDFYVMMTNGRLQKHLRQAGVAEPEDFLARYLAGDAQIESTQPVRHLQALATQARAHTPLRQLILALPPDVHAQTRALAPEFFGGVEEFISRYGDRTMGELKLETRTMRTEPAIFYQYLRNYLGEAAPGAARPDTPGLHAAAGQELARLLQTCSWRLRRRVNRGLPALQRAIQYRESLRLERTRLFGMYRAAYLALGEKLAATRRLPAARDIFLLTEAEIARLLTPGSDLDGPELVRQRRQEFAHYATLDVPARLTVPAPPLAAEAVAAPADGVLRGTGCFPGVVSGEVVVITDPGGDFQVTGKIICALRTDPGWAALFPTCRGVIIEKGSALSHSVILLRELGIPTIVNVPAVTRHLRSGQQIILNAATGEIRIAADEKAS
ncbi:PEP/pyruvate-binding domain-containing protein [Hymenobacter algoricola]|uniref:Phosphoenolpyruvate synthase n=1 Tax=Hymenobacter algoricola TaxID=486267 RepID=A0ABP7N185_9BACT